jgi:hypothetical protein
MVHNHRPTPTHQQPTNQPASNTSSAELCSITTDDMILSNELQNVIEKEFEFRSLQKKINLFETSGFETIPQI